MSELDRTRLNWERFGATTPLLAILNEPGRADWKIDDFFASGRRDVAKELEHLARLGIAVNRGRALDFGCGVGRLTQALAGEFATCDGVDVAQSMIELAQRFNRFRDSCRFHVNPNPDLRVFPDESFDFALSIIVLQHIPPAVAKTYISEFVRVLRPGGVAVFQVPARSRTEPLALGGGGFKAEIIPVEPPRRLSAGARHQLTAKIRNAGDEPWRRGMFIRFIDRWYRGGRPWAPEDGRTELPGLVNPGDEISMSLTVRAPLRPGDYSLELDLLQEGVGTFSERRAEASVRLPVTVTLSRAAAGAVWRRLPGARQLAAVKHRLRPVPTMDMNCIPEVEVTAVVEAAGGRVADISELDVCGEAYESYRYVVVKRS